MDFKDKKKRIEAAYKLLAEETTSRKKFESIRVLIKGLNPRIESLLGSTSKALSDVDKFQRGDVIILSAESLPQNSDEEKKRKKRFLLLINSWRQLEGEVKKISLEFDNTATPTDKITSVGKIISSIKGPFGLITLGVLIVVGASFFFKGMGNDTPTQQSKTEVLPAATTPSTVPKTQVIIFNRKKLPVKELHIGRGPECMSAREQADHYHALHNGTVKALDGTVVEDPDGCGFGKVKDMEIVEVE